ncbi:hypothetical protein CKO51_09745 [Rhodopirellula sp. SM50]|nr:hypothetical protein CKO51_09745 [Rhodopirellula sp. SM50]
MGRGKGVNRLKGFWGHDPTLDQNGTMPCEFALVLEGTDARSPRRAPRQRSGSRSWPFLPSFLDF